MNFDTILYRAEKRADYLVLAILHMMLITLRIEVNYFDIKILFCKTVETAAIALFIYAMFQSKRKMLLICKFVATPLYLLNLLYYIYLGYQLNYVMFLLLLFIAIYLMSNSMIWLKSHNRKIVNYMVDYLHSVFY